VTVYKTGKNLVDVQDMKDTYPWTSATYKGYALFVGSNKTVTVSYNWAPVNGHNFYICLGIHASERNKSNVPIAQWMYHKTISSYDKQKCTVTVDSDGYLYINVYTTDLSDFYSCILDNNFQVEYGTEKTSYEPFKSFDQLTIPFPQTIYGGYVDLVKGEVVETYGKKEFTGQESLHVGVSWQQESIYLSSYSDGSEGINVVPFGEMLATELFCNMCKPINSGSYYSNVDKKIMTKGNTTGKAWRYIIWGQSGFGSTLEEVQATLADLYNNGTPFTVVGRYAEPWIKTYSLDPETIKTLKGINNIWSDANGNIEVKFWKH
jgi:hypothetical protein